MQINNITLYDLMSETRRLQLLKNNNNSFRLSISDDDYNELINDDDIHGFAIESFADFCENFLHQYKQQKGN